ncbi:MAG: hypothetical protein KDD53_10080 [Bdellovibrionales bacterium]|nr:hypothetical protein [Bdellovibrionales bacterium]
MVNKNTKYRCKIPLAAFSACIVFALIQFAAWHSRTFWINVDRYAEPFKDDQIRFSATIKLAQASGDPRKLVALIGSSQVREGIDAKFLNASDPTHVYLNLGLSGSAPPLEMFMRSSEFLAAKPASVYYFIYVGSLFSEYRYSKLKEGFSPAIIPFIIQDLGAMEIWFNRSYYIQSLAGQVLPFYRFRDSLLRIFEKRAQDFLDKRDRAPNYYNFSQSQPPDYFKQQIEKHRTNLFRPNRFESLNVTLLTELIQKVRLSHAKFILVESPVHPLFTNTVSQKVLDTYRDVLAKVISDNSLDYIGTELLPKFDSDDFIDFTHLNSNGRSKLTKYILKSNQS